MIGRCVAVAEIGEYRHGFTPRRVRVAGSVHAALLRSRRATGCGPGRQSQAGDKAFCVLSWAERLTVPDRPRPRRATGWRRPRLLAALAGQLAGCPTTGGARPAALRADDQGTDLHADRGHRGRADHVAAGDTGWRAQLGLPVHLDAGLDVHAAGAALPAARLGGRRVHAVRRGRRADRGRVAADHVRHRRSARPDRDRPGTSYSGYEGAHPVRVGNAAFDQKQNDVFGAVLDSILLHTRHSQRLPRRLWPIVMSQAEGATQGLARPRPGHLGGARRAAALRVVEADVLGGARPRRQARRDPRRPERPPNGATADEIQADILAHGVTDQGVLRAALRHRRARRLDAARRDRSGSCPATTSGCGTRSTPSPTT